VPKDFTVSSNFPADPKLISYIFGLVYSSLNIGSVSERSERYKIYHV